MYEIIKDNNKTLKFENDINKLIQGINNKEEYLKIVKEKNLYGWFIKNKIYYIRPGLYPINKNYKNKLILLSNYGIYNFFKDENITFYCDDGLDIYKKYKNDKENLIFLDPPYMSLCNSFYKSSITSIYEYLYNNNIQNDKAKIFIILENSWIIKLLYNNNDNKFITYDKKYRNQDKKKTTHIIVTN